MSRNEGVVDSIIVKCMTRHAKAMYNKRKKEIDNDELYEEMITILGLLGEATDRHGHCAKLDDAKTIVWHSIEHDKDMKHGYSS